ncbi:hypothetical protein FFLO_01573 [Filobasidium floriforme]|uniref:Alpha-1,2-mannosyltransferase n=1 Tax=Filobasidium floriforme TaxID=5210 RepID=A0A8K0NSP7_9TREE|nr:mannosyltransferase putative-domain-containing protein [Filobasidium floriforme]KAG7563015.1 hypothetical protein FFLO_01573 [Filobasidium floriforme]KAH8079250.1 mannosyltransferase putative-domain-containing protein [Filobasidium floriforme]
MVEPNIKMSNMTRRGSGSPRESKDWTTMTAIDPERRGSGVNPEMAGLMAPLSDRDSGTPSHDHHSDPLLNAWGRRTGGAEATAQGRFNQFSFPTSRTSSNAPSGRFSMILQSKLFRNIAVLTTSLLLILSVLHTTKPEVLGSGLKYMSNLPGLSRLAQQEIRSLDERLRDLMTRPVLEQWELELTNRYQCPMYTYSRMTYFFHEGKEEQWKSIGRDDIRKYRNKMISHLKEVEESGEPLVWTPALGGPYKRGIILTGGEGSTIPRLHILLKMLRKTLGCTLPIEIYHFPDEMEDEAVRNELIAWGDVSVVKLGAKTFNGEKNWHIKNAAFIQSEFTEFVYMDSDNIPLVDPAEHFESVEFKENRSVFWPDLNKDHPDNAIWRILGRPCSDEHWPAEAGQVVYDKRGNNGLNLAVLHLANHMMTSPDLYGFLGYGDKDTFRWSFYALGLPYQQAPRQFASTGGFQRQGGEPDPSYFCGHSMLHWGLTPQNKRNDPSYHPPPAFLHTILSKHRKNLDPAKLWSHVRKPRLDGISEPTLTRTLYEFTGDCFAITLKGPDGLPNSTNSMRDYQGVLTEPLSTVFGPNGETDEIYLALMDIAPTFVAIA